MAFFTHQCCGSTSSLLTGTRLQVNPSPYTSNRVIAPRAVTVCKCQGGLRDGTRFKELKKVGAAVAAALLLNGAAVDVSLAQSLFSGENPVGPAVDILNNAKQEGNENFAEAQRTGQETVGETARASREGAPPALSQVNVNDEEASDPIADKIASRAEFGAETAPGTSQQQGKTSSGNPIEKAFSTPTRGIGDKLGETVAQITNRDQQKLNEVPGQGISGERPGVFDGLFGALRNSAANRDDGRRADQNVYGTGS